MNARIAKKRPRISRVKLSEAYQEKLLDAVLGESEGHSSRSRQQSADSGDLASPVHSRKRQVDAVLEIIPVPAKKARLTQANLRQLIQVEIAEQVAKTIPQQPKPLPLQRPHASFLENSVDQLPPSTAKRYRPESVDSFVTQWVESASWSYRERYCRSDTFLGYSDRDLIPRRLTKSAPSMEYPRDVDGFVIPASTGSRSYGQSFVPFDAASSTGSGRSSGARLVEDPNYREINLAANNIYMRPLYEQLPEHITSLIDHVGRDRDSPGPSLDQIRQDAELNELWMGSAEPNVEKYFQTNIFPNPEPSNPLKRTDRLSMPRSAVPAVVGSAYKVSTPIPDMLYGYSRNGAFPQQQAQLLSMGTEMVANSQSLLYPFFVIEFKADGPSGPGSLWVATNQCLGGSTTCVNIAERLNYRLRQCKSEEVQLINSAVFSVAMSGTEARLYISWKHDELISYMASVNNFLLQRPDHYVEFRKYVLNIIDWGKDKHLKEIQRSLDSLLEDGMRKTSEAAKSRQLSSNDSASSSSSKRRASSGNR